MKQRNKYFVIREMKLSMKQVIVMLMSAMYIMLAVSVGMSRDVDRSLRGKDGKIENCKQCERFGAIRISVRSIEKENITDLFIAAQYNSVTPARTNFSKPVRVLSYTCGIVHHIPIYLTNRSILI